MYNVGRTHDIIHIWESFNQYFQEYSFSLVCYMTSEEVEDTSANIIIEAVLRKVGNRWHCSFHAPSFKKADTVSRKRYDVDPTLHGITISGSH